MLTDERHELLCCYQKCDRINKSEQPQNDKTRQPIGIAAREKLVENVFVIHDADAGERVPQTFDAQNRLRNATVRQALNVEHSTIAQPEIRNAKSTCQGGELNSRPRAYESPALPLSYPGAATRFGFGAARVNGGKRCDYYFDLAR